MQIQLSQKERMFLEDGKIQEEVCVEKYKDYSQQAADAQLKQLFTKLSGEEQHHQNIINEMLQGQQPNLSHNQTQQPVTQSTPQRAMNNQHDKILCTDLLSTEKYVSGTYDIDIFESAEPIVRQAMQHLQQDEQRHGQELFNYMNSHGMYDVK
ncbi:spore coat protein [Clostridium algoriphilum]|uniref:spore coat protein n=1 Tax=Clostridium algoriphilum TaxID=198347 RepID=UPI001CF45607|nr:spore coat protein [Clostridium algoriphilum]MCB2294222.1 spore coat protein [Clostridium algoriphilum]